MLPCGPGVLPCGGGRSRSDRNDKCERQQRQRRNTPARLIGPPGVFLLNSKVTHNTAAAGGDALRAGRLAYSGATFRSDAKRINHPPQCSGLASGEGRT